MTAARFENVRLHYGDTLALDRVSLTVDPGELLPILGPSGCGKTTLLRILAGLAHPDSGRVYIGEDLVNDPDPRLAAHQRGIGMVFQQLALWPHLTALGNLEFGLKARGMSRKERRKLALEALEHVGLTGLERRLPSALSGGERQRVALARAVAGAPRLLLLDEPLSSVDAMLKDDLLAQVRSINRDLGLTTLYITHDKNEALSLGRRIVVMEQGKLVQVGTPEDLYRRPAGRFVATLMGTNNLFYANQEKDNVFTPMPGADPTGPKPPGACLVAIRPEGLGVGAGAGNFEGTVEASVFQGDSYLLSVKSDKLNLKVHVDSAVEPGSGVRLHLKEAPILLE